MADDVKGKIYDRRLYARLLHYLKPYLKWVFLSLFVLLFVAGAEVVIPLIQRTAIDDLIVSNRSLLIFEDEAVPRNLWPSINCRRSSNISIMTKTL